MYPEVHDKLEELERAILDDVEDKTNNPVEFIPDAEAQKKIDEIGKPDSVLSRYARIDPDTQAFYRNFSGIVKEGYISVWNEPDPAKQEKALNRILLGWESAPAAASSPPLPPTSAAPPAATESARPAATDGVMGGGSASGATGNDLSHVLTKKEKQAQGLLKQFLSQVPTASTILDHEDPSKLHTIKVRWKEFKKDYKKENGINLADQILSKFRKDHKKEDGIHLADKILSKALKQTAPRLILKDFFDDLNSHSVIPTGDPKHDRRAVKQQWKSYKDEHHGQEGFKGTGKILHQKFRWQKSPGVQKLFGDHFTKALGDYGAGLDAFRGYYTGVEYFTDWAPPNIGGVLMTIAPAITLPPGAWNLLTYNGEQLPWRAYERQEVLHRIGQGGYILGNFVFTLHSRSPAADYNQMDEPYGKDNSTSAEKYDLYISETEPNGAPQVNNALALLHNFRSGDTNKPHLVAAAILDLTNLFSLSIASNAGIGDRIGLSQTIQESGDDQQTDSLISGPVEQTTGKTDYGADQGVYDLFGGGLLDYLSWHSGILARTAYQMDFQAEMSKLGPWGTGSAIAINGLMYGLDIAAPWVKDKDPLMDSAGHLTVRGKQVLGNGVGFVGSTLGTPVAKGDPDYLGSFALTNMRAQTAVTNFYPEISVPIFNEAYLGYHGMDLGTDAFALAEIGIGVYQVGGNGVQAVTAALRDAAHPGDWRNWVDYGTNSAIDAGLIISAIAYGKNPENNLEKKAELPYYLFNVGGPLSRQAVYWGLCAFLTPDTAQEYLEKTGGNLIGGTLDPRHNVHWGLTPSGTMVTFTISQGHAE